MRKLALSYTEHIWNMDRRINKGVGNMTDMIDGPMLVGIAALITSIANFITTLRPRDRLRDRTRARRISKRRKGGG